MTIDDILPSPLKGCCCSSIQDDPHGGVCGNCLANTMRTAWISALKAHGVCFVPSEDTLEEVMVNVFLQRHKVNMNPYDRRNISVYAKAIRQLLLNGGSNGA